jgi:protein SCO1/2
LDASYRLGNSIVLGTVVASLLAVCLAFVLPVPAAPRAGQALGELGFPVGTFRLTERSGRTVTDADLADRVWVASFIFTRCPLSCPRISSVMKGLQPKLAGTSVRLVSVTVDPEHDTPEVLAEYAKRFDADPDRWWFLTGPKDAIVTLVTERFKLGLQATSESDRQAGAEAFSHSDRLALVDRGKVVHVFDSSDPRAVEELIADARLRGAPSWVRRLPGLNAALNGSCAILLTLGWFQIRRGRVRAHASCMIAGVVVSALFLTSYLVYHYYVGSVPFRGVGPVRLVYFTVLLSHTLLATFAVVPLVTVTLTLAIRRRFASHARVARLTFPIWMYVSITGVLIYLMLYQLPIPTALRSPG